MKEFLTEGIVGNIEYNAQKQIRESIQNRWDSLGFTEGLPDGIKENVATLYENEAKHMIYEATASDNSGSFETVVFPIIRRVFSKLLANDIVSVQAMNLPVGKLFFILPVTSEREWELPSMSGSVEPGDIVDGTTGRHKGLMGYGRINRNKEGRQEPRYYLPDSTRTSGMFHNSTSQSLLQQIMMLHSKGQREQVLQQQHFVKQVLRLLSTSRSLSTTSSTTTSSMITLRVRLQSR